MVFKSIPIDEKVSEGSDNGIPVILKTGHATDAMKAIVDVIISDAIPLNKITDCTVYSDEGTPVDIN